MPNLVRDLKVKVGFQWGGGGGSKKPLPAQLELTNTPLEINRASNLRALFIVDF